ncbi:MAG: hypothetical protein ACI9CE_001526 [Flavobacterium sp.]|jgi:hypothetical protein
MSSIIESRLSNAERELTENIISEISPVQLGNLLKQPGDGLSNKMENALAEGFSERVMLKIISIRLKQDKLYSFFVNFLVTNMLVIAVMFTSVLSSRLGSFDYQPLANMPSPSYILPGLVVLLILSILDQGVISKTVVDPMPVSLN